MAYATLTIPGVSGSVSTEYSFWKGYRFSVNGTRIKPHGFPRTRLKLPGLSGPVEAQIKGGQLRAHPSLVVDDREYATGPPTPKVEQALAVLPIVLLLVLQGALGFLLAFGAIAINMSTIRAERPASTKIAIMLAVLLVGGAIEFVVVKLILSAGR